MFAQMHVHAHTHTHTFLRREFTSLIQFLRIPMTEIKVEKYCAGT